MSQMINEFYKYDTSSFTDDITDEVGNYIQTNTYIYKDYTSYKYFEIADWDEVTDPEWTELYKLEDNDKIETVSQDVYGTPDYWDLILGINARNPLFDLIYGYDTLEEAVNIYIEKYIGDYLGVMSDAHKEKLKAIFLQERLDKNEEYRNIRVIRPRKLQDFFRLMKDRGFYIKEEEE